MGCGSSPHLGRYDAGKLRAAAKETTDARLGRKRKKN